LARVTGPLLSLEASGSVADAVTYQKGLKSRMVRKMPQRKYGRSTDQNTVRIMFNGAVTHWHELLTSQQTLWKQYTDGDGNKSFQAFMHQWIIRGLDGLPQYELPPTYGYCIVGEYLVGELITGGVYQTP